MKTLAWTSVLGLWLAPLFMKAQRCDSLRLAFRGQWHWDGDTLYIDGGFLTAYPRLGPIGPTPPPGNYTWYWWLNQLQGGSYFRSGSLTGGSPTLNVQLNYGAHPTYYELWLVVIGNAATGTGSCTDSLRIIIRGDTIHPQPNYRCDSIRNSVSLLIGGRSVRFGGTVTLPTGSYTFNISPRDMVYGWRLTGPSGTQTASGIFAPSSLDTLYLTSPGTHQLDISVYYAGCLPDTLRYFIQAIDSFPGISCQPAVNQPCHTRLIVNNATYLPGQFVQLANGVYTFHLAPVSPPSTSSLNCQYTWRICGDTIPGGCMSGQGSNFSAYIGPARYSVDVISTCQWICETTQVCRDTVSFTLSGGFNPNDTVVVSHPGSPTPYHPGDTIPLPLDTVCIYAGVQTLHPDSLYWWNWIYYGPNGQPLDSGITPVSCIYPTSAGVYSLVYGLVPPPNQRTAQNRSYTFYLHFGRTAGLNTSPSSVPVLYPNPTSGPLWITLPEAVPYRLTVMDPTGRVIEALTVKGGGSHLLPFRLASGVYILRAESGTQLHTLRVVVSE